MINDLPLRYQDLLIRYTELLIKYEQLKQQFEILDALGVSIEKEREERTDAEY